MIKTAPGAVQNDQETGGNARRCWDSEQAARRVSGGSGVLRRSDSEGAASQEPYARLRDVLARLPTHQASRISA